MFATPVLSGCVSHIEILQPPTSAPVAVATVAPARHSVAILGIDFDPPLSEVEALAEGGVTLLVAVENQGISVEEDVVVTARLVDQGARGVQRDLLSETVVLESIEPGELQVARFAHVSRLPLRDSYALLIETPAVPGETLLNDNVRRYDIIIHGGD